MGCIVSIMLGGVRLDHCINLRGDIYADVAGWLEMASEGCLKAVTDGGVMSPSCQLTKALLGSVSVQ